MPWSLFPHLLAPLSTFSGGNPCQARCSCQIGSSTCRASRQRGWGVRVEADQIAAVAPNADLRQAYPEDEVVEASGQTLAPGFVDAHTHLYGVLAHGIPLHKAPSGFWPFLIDFWWPLVEDRLDHETICAATDLNLAQMFAGARPASTTSPRRRTRSRVVCPPRPRSSEAAASAVSSPSRPPSGSVKRTASWGAREPGLHSVDQKSGVRDQGSGDRSQGRRQTAGGATQLPASSFQPRLRPDVLPHHLHLLR